MMVHAQQLHKFSEGCFAELQGKNLNIVTWRYWIISMFTRISKVRTCYSVQINTHPCADWA